MQETLLDEPAKLFAEFINSKFTENTYRLKSYNAIFLMKK